jgi:hypothetical protein
MVPHRPSHWILLVLVVLAAIFTLREVHGQTSTNARAQFEGMPAMAGAQAGLGAQAGPAQGGIGLQGSDGAAIGLRLRPPAALREPDSSVVAANDVPDTLLPHPPRVPQRSVGRDTGVAKDVGSSPNAAKRSVRHVVKRVQRQSVASVQ